MVTIVLLGLVWFGNVVLLVISLSPVPGGVNKIDSEIGGSEELPEREHFGR